MSIAIMVQGGAGSIAVEREPICQAGCQDAAQLGWQILLQGGTALDAVETAVRALEDNPNFNAGTGSCLTLTGNIEMDAGIMEGHTLHTGAVCGIELIKNPISLARKVMANSRHVLLASSGAQDFAQKNGISLCKFEDLLVERQHNRWLQTQAQEMPDTEKKHGTVGAVALDASGHLAAATSTGGMLNKYPGRVGDTPLIGCGFYADSEAAISTTGRGEDIIRVLLAKRAADLVAQGATAQAAAEAAIAYLAAHTTGDGGLIVIDRRGNIGFSWNSESMSYAAISRAQ